MGDIEGAGRFFHTQSTEEPALYYSCVPGIECRQLLERVIQVDQIIRAGIDGDLGFFEAQGCEACPPLLPLAASGVIDQDPAHRPGGSREEVGSAALGHIGLVDQAQVGLVDERGSLEGVVGSLAGKLPMRHVPELIVQQRQDVLHGFRTAVVRGQKPCRGLRAEGLLGAQGR